MKLNVETLLEAIFNRDFLENGKYSHISQIGIVTIKSLIPSKEDLGVRIDYRRFDEEVKLWRQYKTSEDSLISHSDYGGEYFEEDATSTCRSLILAIVNKDLKILEEEIIKSNLYSSGNILSLFKNLILAYRIFYYLALYNTETALDLIKDHLINFSQKDYFDRYGKHYRVNPGLYEKNYSIEFEKTKIDIISLLNGVKKEKLEEVDEYINLEKISEEELKSLYSKLVYDWISDREQAELPKFYKDMSSYVESLRRGRIEPDVLHIKEYVLPDVFSYELGDEFYHSLLKQSKVLKKEIINGEMLSLIQTKTGVYVFKK